jgi:hypothetical protein
MIKLQIFLVLALWMGTVCSVQAQHHMHGMGGSGAAPDSGMAMTADMPEVPMTHAYSLHLPMSRNGSGTAWLPDASPMYGIMLHSSRWMYMFHGSVSARYTVQDIGDKGSRGGSDFDAPNWLMAMGQRRVGTSGLFHFDVMISLDRLTEGGAGYPLLFQTGESWRGTPLVDRQHPHDLFSALSVAYTYALSAKSDLSFYLGYPGEPALGSVAFMHRPSAAADPDAPISHHWNDGTHITFGVATLGYRYGNFKLEASSFTGREPDENRYGFDKPRFDSWSGRLSFNPGPNWALQVSRGWIKSPEALHPEENVSRTTASAIYSLVWGGEKSMDATAVWGLNQISGEKGENAVLLEADLRLKRLALYTRYEWVQKSLEEMNLDAASYGKDAVFPVNALTLGLNYDLFTLGKIRVAAGAQLTGYHPDSRLNNLYGVNPLSGEVFLRIYPSLMKMSM